MKRIVSVEGFFVDVIRPPVSPDFLRETGTSGTAHGLPVIDHLLE